MEVRFDLKVVLECWDNRILTIRMNSYDRFIQHLLSVGPYISKTLRTLFLFNFHCILQIWCNLKIILVNNFTKYLAWYWWWLYPKAYSKKIMLLPHLWNLHHQAFKNVTKMNVFYFNVNNSTKHNIISNSWTIYSTKFEGNCLYNFVEI